MRTRRIAVTAAGLSLAAALFAGCLEATRPRGRRWEKAIAVSERPIPMEDAKWFEVYEAFGAPADGRMALLEVVGRARTFATRLSVSEEAARFADEILARSGPGDLDRVHAAFPNVEDLGARSVRLVGAEADGAYRISLASGADWRPARSGDAILEVVLRPSSWRVHRSYRAVARLRVDTGAVTGRAAVLAVDRFLERYASHPDGERALGSLSRAFPHTLSRARTLFRLRGEPGFALERDTKSLSRFFPRLGGYLDRLDDVFALSARAAPESRSPEGRPLAFGFESKEARLDLDCPPLGFASGGSFRGLASLAFRPPGFEARIEDLPFAWTIESRDGAFELDGRLSGTPRSIEVRKGILARIGNGLMRSITGNDLDRMIEDFAGAMVDAPTTLAVRWGPQDGRNVLEIEVETELLAGRLIALGYRIFDEFYGIDGATFAEVLGLADVLLEGIERDIERSGRDH